MKKKTDILTEEVCKETKLNNPREIEVLYQKMLVVIIILSGLGNPTVPEVMR